MLPVSTIAGGAHGLPSLPSGPVGQEPSRGSSTAGMARGASRGRGSTGGGTATPSGAPHQPHQLFTLGSGDLDSPARGRGAWDDAWEEREESSTLLSGLGVGSGGSVGPASGVAGAGPESAGRLEGWSGSGVPQGPSTGVSRVASGALLLGGGLGGGEELQAGASGGGAGGGRGRSGGGRDIRQAHS